jgi:hypothetical protein
LIIDIDADVFNSSRRVNACDRGHAVGEAVIIVPTAVDRVDVDRGGSSVRGAAVEGQLENEAVTTFDCGPRMTIGQWVAWVG